MVLKAWTAITDTLGLTGKRKASDDDISQSPQPEMQRIDAADEGFPFQFELGTVLMIKLASRTSAAQEKNETRYAAFGLCDRSAHSQSLNIHSLT